MNVLLLGGSKSGKSSAGQKMVKLLSNGGRMIYWAAMEPVDEEDEARIKMHIIDRAGWGFETVECGKDILNRAGEVEGASVLFDSITALLANEMFGGDFPDSSAAERAAESLIELSEHTKDLVCVCDEVFRDGISYEPLTEEYRRGLAYICRRLALEFDAVCEASCGLISFKKFSSDDFEEFCDKLGRES